VKSISAYSYFKLKRGEKGSEVSHLILLPYDFKIVNGQIDKVNINSFFPCKTTLKSKFNYIQVHHDDENDFLWTLHCIMNGVD
jgi:hypothetical protein